MNRSRHQLLTRAGGAEQEHIGLSHGRLRDLRAQTMCLGTHAEEFGGCTDCVDLRSPFEPQMQEHRIGEKNHQARLQLLRIECQGSLQFGTIDAHPAASGDALQLPTVAKGIEVQQVAAHPRIQKCSTGRARPGKKRIAAIDRQGIRCRTGPALANALRIRVVGDHQRPALSAVAFV